MLSEEDIISLPDPVQNYIRLTGSIGKPKVQNFNVAFEGKIRKDEQTAWMEFNSEQLSNIVFFVENSIIYR